MTWVGKKNRKGMMFGLPLKLLTTFQNKASAVGKITWVRCSTWLCFNILFKQIFNLEHLKKLFSLNSRIKNSRGMTFTLPTSAQPLIQALFSLQQCIKKTLLSCLFTENLKKKNCFSLGKRIWHYSQIQSS